MRKEIIIPPGDGHSNHPFFNSLPFTYRVTYLTSKSRTKTIEYLTPHEIILNLKSFRPLDQITYVNRENAKDVFTITFEKFSFMIAESILDASSLNLELFYGRLLLTNTYSKSIADKGKLRYYDDILRSYLLKLKGGVDFYLSFEQRKTILYIKSRRPSIHHICTILQNHQSEDNPHFYHINIPNVGPTLQNQGLLVELINTFIPRNRFRIYSYNPQEGEDNIIQTDISREIIQIINQLIN